MNKDALKQHLEESRQTLLAALEGIEGDAWNTPVQSDGERWTALQMLRHLADAHKGLNGQVERILKGEATVPPDFDIDRWNNRRQEKMAEVSVEASMQMLAETHTQLLGIVDNLAEEDAAKSGYQTSLKREIGLEEFIRLIGSHEALHAGEIAAAVKK